MIYSPLQTLVDAGIRDILIVTGGSSAGDFLRLLRNGKDFGLEQVSFAYQEGEGGIADALRLAECFAQGQSICVILGDNIIEAGIGTGPTRVVAEKLRGRHSLEESCRTGRCGVAAVNHRPR